MTKRKVRVIVIHSMEAPEKGETAENVAKYFARTDTKASAHVCIDNNSVVQCVNDNDIAYAAPGCNNDGIQVELAGYARQSYEDWLDEYSFALLHVAANVVAQYCVKYEIPALKLNNTELESGLMGVVGHHQVSAVYKRSTHTDPGPNFPWDIFMRLVRRYHTERLA